jgi:hypothetical protein
MNAFMHAIIDEKIFMKLPSGYQISKPGTMLELKKALHSLRRSPLILAERAGFSITLQAIGLYFSIMNPVA